MEQTLHSRKANDTPERGNRIGMINYLAFSSVGKDRETNGDRVFIDDMVLSYGPIIGNSDKEIIAGICDGVGSTHGGDFAAEIVASSFKENKLYQSSALSISRHLHQINSSILHEQQKNPTFNNMATTVAGVILFHDRYLIYNIGDTRVYYVESGSLELKSKDHILSKGEKNHLTGYLGGNGLACNPSIRKGIIANDRACFFICSDGVYPYISEEHLKQLLISDKSLEEKKEAVLQVALQNGSPDDISFVIIEYSS